MRFSVEALYEWYRQTIRNPKYRWWIILGTLAYLVLPIDLAPDFIPVVGQLDDIFLLTLLVSEVSQLLIERVKTSKGKDSGFTQPDANPKPTSADPVDVKAVSVE